MKERKMKRSLIPDPIRGLLDIQIAGNIDEEIETQGYAVDEPIKTFYDPDFNPKSNKDGEILSIYDNARYGNKKLAELKKWCMDRGLAVSGTKKQLIDRLHEHTERVKREKEEEELRKQIEEREVVTKHKDTALLKIRNNIKRLTRARFNLLGKLVKAQQTFDSTETELNEMKATLKSLEKVL